MKKVEFLVCCCLFVCCLIVVCSVSRFAGMEFFVFVTSGGFNKLVVRNVSYRRFKPMFSTPFPAGESLSFNHHFLHLHIIPIDKSNHIHSRCGMDALADAAVDGLAAEDAAIDVNHLQGGFTFVADDPVTIAIESKGLIVAVCVLAEGRKH